MGDLHGILAGKSGSSEAEIEAVLYTIPEPETDLAMSERFGWLEAQALKDEYAGSVADEVIRQRRLD